MRESGGLKSIGASERLKLEEILEMCADYERQIEAEQKQGLLIRRQMEEDERRNRMAPPHITHLQIPPPASPVTQQWSPNGTMTTTPNRYCNYFVT